MSNEAPQRKSILIIEDEDIIRENLKSLLELEGYCAFEAVNGKDGLAVLSKIPRPCLILLDLLMPVMTGEEFLKEMSTMNALASIPICIVSGIADSSIVSLLKKRGVSDFIKKPLEFDSLLRFIKKYCGPPVVSDESR